MHTRRPMTASQRQEIIALRQLPHNCSYKQIAALTDRPYNTIAGVCRDAGLQHHPATAVTIVHDPSNTYKLGPTLLNQADLSYMLSLSNLPNGFKFTIGSHSIITRDGIYFRDDGWYCPPNRSGTLIWHEPQGDR